MDKKTHKYDNDAEKRSKAGFYRVLGQLPPTLNDVLEDSSRLDYSVLEHDETRVEPNFKLPMYTEGAETLDWRPMVKLSFQELLKDQINTFADGGASITAVDRVGLSEANDEKSQSQFYDEWANSPDVITGYVAVGFDNGFVVIYKERMSSFSVEALSDPNAFKLHCTFSAEGSERNGDPIRTIDLSPNGLHCAVTFNGNDFKSRELVEHVYEFDIPSVADPHRIRHETHQIKVDRSDDDYGEVPLLAKASTTMYRGQITCAVYSHDSEFIAFGYNDIYTQGSVNIWCRQAAVEAFRAESEGESDGVLTYVSRVSSTLCDALCFLKDGNLALGCVDGVLRVIAIKVTQIFVKTGPDVDADGELVVVRPEFVGLDDDCTMVWNTGASRRASKAFPHAHDEEGTRSLGQAHHARQRKQKFLDKQQGKWVQQKLLERERLLFELPLHTREISDLSLSKAGDRLVSTCGTAPVGESPIKVIALADMYNLKQDELIRTVDVKDHRSDLIDERANSYDPFVKVGRLDPDEGRAIVTCTDSPDDRIRIFDAISGALVAESKQGKRVTTACFIADGYAIACGGPDGYLYIYNCGLAESFRSVGNEGPISCAAMSHCGRVVSTSDRDDIKFFDAQTGTFLAKRALRRLVQWVAFPPSTMSIHPYSYAAAMCGPRNALGQDFEDGRVTIFKYKFDRTASEYDDTVFDLEVHRQNDIEGSCNRGVFHPSGELLVITSSKKQDGLVYMMSATRGTVLWSSRREGVRVGSASFTSDGSLILASWLDGEVRIMGGMDGTYLTRFRCFDKLELSSMTLQVSDVAWGRPIVVDTDAHCAKHNLDRAHIGVSCEVQANGTDTITSMVRLFVVDNLAYKKYRAIVDPNKDTSSSYPQFIENRERTCGWGATRERRPKSRPRVWRELTGFSDKVDDLDFNDDGTIVATACRDGVLRLHLVRSGELIYESENHGNRVVSCQFGSGVSATRIITATYGGYWHNFPYYDYFNSIVMLVSTLALQPFTDELLRAILKRVGRLCIGFRTQCHGNINDILMSNPVKDAFIKFNTFHPLTGKVAGGAPLPRMGLQKRVTPIMIGNVSSVPAFRRLIANWPFHTPVNLFLQHRYPTKDSRNQDGARRSTRRVNLPRVSVLDCIMAKPKSAETISALIHILEHLNYCGFEYLDVNSNQESFWAVARAIPDMINTIPDLALLALRMELHDVQGCEHIQFRANHEDDLDNEMVSTMTTPHWGEDNVEFWDDFIVQETMEVAPDKVRMGLSRFGIVPKVIPLPGADLLWDSVIAAARKDTELGNAMFDTQIVAGILQLKWREVNQIFKFHLFLYVAYLGLMTYLTVSYARESQTTDRAVGLQQLYAGTDTIGAVNSIILWVVTGLNIWFLIHEGVKLKQLGRPTYRPFFFLVDWLAHLLFFVGIVLYAEVPRQDIQKVVFTFGMLCAWLKFIFFSRVDRRWSRVTSMFHMFPTKLMPFLLIMISLYVGFSFMFMTLHPPSSEAWTDFPEAILSVMSLSFGDFAAVERREDGWDTINGTTTHDFNSVVHSRWLYYTQIAMVVIFVFTMSVFMLNVLIAILTIEYQKIAQTSTWRVEQAMLVRELGCLYRFMKDEELYDLSWLEFDETNSSGKRKVNWLHVIPPDNDAFWYTNSKPEDNETAQVRSLEQIEVALEELKMKNRLNQMGTYNKFDELDNTATFTKSFRDIQRKVDKVAGLLQQHDQETSA
eukprot:m.134392 g.134392  ORF g.134392 m.134392 type:complete len:1715 (-) comp29738_c1_seq1:83-5227(-)